MFMSKTKRFLLNNYITLYYYQEIIDKYRIYYDRNHFRRLFQYLDTYCLFQYRKLYPKDYRLRREPDFPRTISTQPLHLRMLRYLMLFYTIRGIAIAFIKPVANTERKRILIGAELFKADYIYLETTFLFWTSISYLYLQFSFTTSPLDYKFLAIFRMSDRNMQYLSPKHFGLSLAEFKQFKLFRIASLTFYNLTMMTIASFGPVCVFLLYLHASLYLTDPLPSIPWTVVFSTWIYFVCTVIYGNLVAFVVVSKYLHIKQKSISMSIQHYLSQLRTFKPHRLQSLVWHKFMQQNLRYSHLQDELFDYNRFWSCYVSIIFVFYVLLISFIIYIMIFSTIATYVKVIYYIIFYVHVVLLSAIIYYSGGIVARNQRLSVKFSCALGRTCFSVASLGNVLNVMKVNHMENYYVQMSESGFYLLNGYLITNDTFRLIIVNITVYFLLILKW